jgi:hypothetical protein
MASNSHNRLLLQDEFLNAFSSVHFARVQIPPGINDGLMYSVELTCITAVMAERARHGSIISVEYPDHIVASIPDQHVLLLRII